MTWQLDLMHHVTYIFFLAAMLHFTFWATTWQLKLIQHGNCSRCHMANTVHYTWQLDLPHHVTCIFCFHAAFFHTAITWQVELTQHGNCISCDMATTIHLDGNSAQLHGNCSCHDVATVVAPHMSISPLFFYLHLTSCTLFPHNPSIF